MDNHRIPPLWSYTVIFRSPKRILYINKIRRYSHHKGNLTSFFQWRYFLYQIRSRGKHFPLKIWCTLGYSNRFHEITKKCWKYSIISLYWTPKEPFQSVHYRVVSIFERFSIFFLRVISVLTDSNQTPILDIILQRKAFWGYFPT